MNFAITAAVTAVILFVMSQIQRRTENDVLWMRQLIIVLKLAVLIFCALYLYFRLTTNHV